MSLIFHSDNLRRLLTTFVALLLTGCIHIPVPPPLSHSAAPVAQETSHCRAALPQSRKIATAARGLSAERIAVLTWNMYKQSRPNWAKDFQRLSKDQDLLLLQEAYMDKDLGSALAKSPYNWAMTTAFFYQDTATGVLTASPSESDSHCALFAKEPVIQTPKSILVSTYPITGNHQKLLVANVHGINFTLGLESYRQQFKALRQVIQNHQGPLILAGDFNSWRKDRQAILDQLADELSLRRVGYDSHQRITVFGNPIDHVYYRNLEVIQASSPKVSSSDHNPLLVTFKVAEAAYNRYAQTPE